MSLQKCWIMIVALTISSPAWAFGEKSVCSAAVTTALKNAVKAAGVSEDFAFDLNEPEQIGTSSDGGIFLKYTTLGAIRVEDGYLTDSTGEVVILQKGKACTVRRLAVQVGRTH